MPASCPGLDPARILGRHLVGDSLKPFAPELAGKRILVTGAGGSLGSALSGQLAAINPQRLVLLDSHENSLAALRKSLGKDTCQYALANIRDQRRVRHIFERTRPQLVFHLAAYKHVDLAEDFPEEYVASNVLATWDLALLSGEYGVERFVYPSSDKAVQPCSTYGATKRVTELILRSLDANHTGTRFVIIRLVNVVGARGSVFDTLAMQMAEGRPVTLTHPDMTRYWMTEGEAMLLMGYAAVCAEEASLLALDTGAAVPLVEIARRMWLHYSRGGNELAIEYVGMRPGERLEELLLSPTERATLSRQAGITKITDTAPLPMSLDAMAARLSEWRHQVEYGEGERLKEDLFYLARLAPKQQEAGSPG